MLYSETTFPFWPKENTLISYMKMNTFNTIFVGKLISFMPKNRQIDCFGFRRD